MTYEKFQDEFIYNLRIRLSEIVPDSFELRKVRPDCHSKPTYNGLQFYRKDLTLSPILNMDELYQMHENGCDPDAMLDMAVRLFSCDYSEAAEKYGQIFDYEFSRPYIVYKLINRERNAELLKAVPHIDLLDMAIVFEILMDDEVSGGLASHLIHNDMAEAWHTDADTLLAVASENTPRILNPDVRTLSATMRDIMQRHGADTEMLDDFDSIYCPPIFVVTNSMYSRGAAAILYKDMLKNLANILDDDFYLIPSSVHEMLAIPADASPQDCEALTEMLREVNRTEVAPEDFLSDHVYFYTRSLNQLSYCCNK